MKLFIRVLALTVVLGVLKYVNAFNVFDFTWGAVFAPLALYLASLACFLIGVMIISLVSK